MQFSLFAVVLAATTIASPTSQTWRDEKRGLEIRGLGDQGDGYYGVAFDANGVGTVKFTPWAQLNHTGEAAAAAEVEVAFNKTTGGIEKRGGYTTCTGEWANGGHLDIANIQLARNSDNGGDNGNFFFYNNWGWISFPPHAYVDEKSLLIILYRSIMRASRHTSVPMIVFTLDIIQLFG